MFWTHTFKLGLKDVGIAAGLVRRASKGAKHHWLASIANIGRAILLELVNHDFEASNQVLGRGVLFRKLLDLLLEGMDCLVDLCPCWDKAMGHLGTDLCLEVKDEHGPLLLKVGDGVIKFSGLIPELLKVELVFVNEDLLGELGRLGIGQFSIQ